MKKKIVACFMVAIICILCFAGCGDSYKTVLSVNTNEPTKKAMKYKLFDGEKEYKIKVKENHPITVSVDITTKRGTLSAFISKTGKLKDAIYSGNSIPTSSFTVDITDPGTYTLHLQANDHKGSYCFKWKEKE